ncbi:unnamed protein product [Alopecurus aequalis]
MPPFRGVCARPNGRFYAEIRTGQRRIVLGTYDTAHEAARAFDAAAWRLDRPRRQMNFPYDARTAKQAAELAPPPVLNTAEDRQRQREVNEQLLVADHDERTMAEYRRRHPEEVEAERAYFTAQRAQRVARREEKRRRRRVAEEHYDNPNAQPVWDENDPRWLDIYTSSDCTTTDED